MTFTSRRTRLVGLALTAIGVHLVVLALFTQESRAAIGALAWLAAAPLLVVAFERSGRAVRTAIPGVLGLGAFAAGTIAHVGHAALNGLSLLDITGIFVAIAGGVLIGVAFASLFGGTRRAVKWLIVPLVVVLAQFYVLPVVVIGTVATNAPRGDGPRAATLGIPGAVDVRFTASDGVPLGAWLVPGTRHAAVVVLHGSHSARKSTTRYVRFLHRAGYTVLAYDARGHGSSGGNENAYGWYGDRDLAGAVAYLRDSGVKRIGALGLSMGGEEALRAAANGVGLGAVVADGAGSGTLGDAKVEEGTNSPLFTAVTWIGMRTVALFSGDREPVPLIEIVGRVHVPVLLVASNRRNEHRMNEVFRDRIGSRATRLWYLGDTGHTQGLARHPREYREHVLGFLESALR